EKLNADRMAYQDSAGTWRLEKVVIHEFGREYERMRRVEVLDTVLPLIPQDFIDEDPIVSQARAEFYGEIRKAYWAENLWRYGLVLVALLGLVLGFKWLEGRNRRKSRRIP
ncbi:MAG: hypothetical protein AAF570_14745, partial [Bacteroidota bacterium]